MRRTALTLWLVLAFGLLGAFVPAAGARAQAVECDDFSTQEEAQDVLDSTNDDDVIDELDPDGDGDACERLPSEEDEEDEDAAEDDEDEDASEDDDEQEDEDTAQDDEDEDATEDEEEEEADDAPSGNPLTARLGGNRDGFEEEYGEPLDDEPAGEYPLGLDYEVDDFGNVNVFFHREQYVAYITLEAARNDEWSPRQAGNAVEPFLPADAELDDDEEETDDGDLLTVGTSEGLADRYSPATYERYGASGDPGDFFVLYRLNEDGDVETIEVGLGDDLQTPVEEEEDEEEQE